MVSCLSGAYKFASVLQCVGLVLICTINVQCAGTNLLVKTIAYLINPAPSVTTLLNHKRIPWATPTYRIRKDKKAGLLVSPNDITVLATVVDEFTFQSPVGPSMQPSAQASGSSTTSQAPSNFVTSDQFMAMSDKWAEQFVHMEALLTRGNIFSTPVSSVKPVAFHQLISDTPFMAPSTRPTSPVEAPVVLDAQVKPKPVDSKEKKKSHKSKKGKKTKDKRY